MFAKLIIKVTKNIIIIKQKAPIFTNLISINNLNTTFQLQKAISDPLLF